MNRNVRASSSLAPDTKYIFMNDNTRISKKEKLLISNSGLFFFNTSLDNKIKLEIIEWYNSLSDRDKNFVDILRREAADEATYFSERA